MFAIVLHYVLHSVADATVIVMKITSGSFESIDSLGLLYSQIALQSLKYNVFSLSLPFFIMFYLHARIIYK